MPGGCPKCVIDSRFLALSAGVLAGLTSDTHPLHAPAVKLAAAAAATADAYKVAIEHGIVALDEDFKWGGCHRASRVMAMVIAVADGSAKDFIETPAGFFDTVNKLTAWTLEELHALAALASGAKIDKGDTL